MAAGLSRPAGPMRSSRIRLFAGAVSSALIAFWGCAGVADYTTAKLVRAGGVEAGANATGYLIALPESEREFSPQVWSAGGSAAIGLTDRANLLAGYQFSRFGSDEGRDGDLILEGRDHRLSAGLKYGWDPLREAIAIAYGYHLGVGLHEIAVAHYTNLYWKRSLYYCFSPSVTFFWSGDGESDEWFPNVVLNQSLTWEPVPHLVVRPQVGVNVFGLFAKILIVNAGMSAGLSF